MQNNLTSQVAVDTAVMGPFYVSTFFGFGCAFIDGGGFDEFKRKMRTDFVPTLALEICVWPFVQVGGCVRCGNVRVWGRGLMVALTSSSQYTH